MEEDEDQSLFVERIAALDLGKAVLEACVRLPHPTKPGRRVQEVRTYSTRTVHLLELADWLRCNQVTTVVMESTSSYWKGVYYLLEAEGFDCQVANAREVKNVPGRPKTDKIDSVWLCKVAERGMFRPSLVHPEPIRRLRGLHPLPPFPGSGSVPGEAAGGEAAGGRPDQARQCDQRHLRGLRPGDARRPRGRAT